MVQSFIQMTNKTKSVRAKINDLEIGESARFPLQRYDYIVSCRTRLQTSSGKSFTSKIDNRKGMVIITRTKDKPE